MGGLSEKIKQSNAKNYGLTNTRALSEQQTIQDFNGLFQRINIITVVTSTTLGL